MTKLTRINDVYVNLDEVAAIKIKYYWNYSKPYHVVIYTGSDTIKEDLTFSEGKHLEALLKERLNYKRRNVYVSIRTDYVTYT